MVITTTDADLYDTTKQNISLHIKNIFDEEGYLHQQLSLVEEAKKRLTDIFKN